MNGVNLNSQDKAAQSDGNAPFFKALKVVSDIFQPNIPTECYGVYSVLARRGNFTSNPNNSIRELATAANVSKATVSRSIEMLVDVGLVKRIRRGGSQPDCYELLNACEAAKRWGAVYVSKSVSYSLSAENARLLKASIKDFRAKQRDNKSASQTDSCVLSQRRQRSRGKHQCASRETQTGSHLIQEEGRNEECPTPTPSHDGATQKNKDTPDEDEPDGLMRWAANQFTGVMKDMGSHLLNTSRPPVPHLANGFADWQEFGFNSLAVEAAARRGDVLELVLSASDPAAARRGLEKYHRAFDASLRTRYGCEVKIALVKAQRQRRCGC